MNSFAGDADWSDGETAIDKEIEIIYKLGQEVLEFENMLTEASEVCGELDRSNPQPLLADHLLINFL